MYGGLHTSSCGLSLTSRLSALCDRRSTRVNRTRLVRPRRSALPEAIPAADVSTSSPSSVLLRSIRNRCKPINPLPDVSSAIRSGLPLTVPYPPGSRACDSDASAAMAQSSVSSGEKNEVNLNGGRKGRSLPASFRSEGRMDEEGDGRANGTGNVYPRTENRKGLPLAKEGHAGHRIMQAAHRALTVTPV
jgi:hypothetical protein